MAAQMGINEYESYPWYDDDYQTPQNVPPYQAEEPLDLISILKEEPKSSFAQESPPIQTENPSNQMPILREEPKPNIALSFKRRGLEPRKQQSPWMSFEQGQCPWCLTEGFPKGPSLGTHQKSNCPMRVDFVDRQIWYCFTCSRGWKQRKFYDKHMLEHETQCEENQQSFESWKDREKRFRKEAIDRMKKEKKEFLKKKSDIRSEFDGEASETPRLDLATCPWCKDHLSDPKAVIPHQINQCPQRFNFLNNGYWTCFTCDESYLTQGEHDEHVLEHETNLDEQGYQKYQKYECKQGRAARKRMKEELSSASKDDSIDENATSNGPLLLPKSEPSSTSTPDVSGSKRKSTDNNLDLAPKKKRTKKSGPVSRVPLAQLDENQ